MAKSKKTSESDRPVFDSIRKPVAPSGHVFGQPRIEEKLHPAGRKAKHKKNKDTEGNDAG